MDWIEVITDYGIFFNCFVRSICMVFVFFQIVFCLISAYTLTHESDAFLIDDFTAS